MSDYRWEGSPYQPTPKGFVSMEIQKSEQLFKNLEIMSKALIRIGLGEKDAQTIAASALYEAGELQHAREEQK